MRVLRGVVYMTKSRETAESATLSLCCETSGVTVRLGGRTNKVPHPGEGGGRGPKAKFYAIA